MTAASSDFDWLPPLGLGGVALGNEFEPITDEMAHQTLLAAWEGGVRYYDVAPWYGLGLAERRLGAFLHRQPRDSYVLSSKVGKLLKASPHNRSREHFPFSPSPNDVVFDYTADGVRRSIEDSLQRLGVSRLDVAFVHDLSPDNALLPGPWEALFEVALKGAFPALTRLREEGVIRAWGLGVNCPQPLMRAMQESDPDLCLMASQYSLVDHANAVEQVFPEARRRGVRFVIGSALEAGFVGGAPRWRYGQDRWEIAPERIERRRRLHEIAGRFGADLVGASLQFAAAPDVVASVVVGAGRPEHVVADIAGFHTPTPPAFWDALREAGLLAEGAATPGPEKEG